jgi:hypothetical protein
MSSTETTSTESGAEATGVDASDLGALNTEQLEQLIKDHEDDPNTQAALQAVIDERKKLEEKIKETSGKAKAPKGPAKSRKGTRAPKGRQVVAAQSFNADPANLERLKKVLDGDPDHDPPIPPVIQADGSYQMTAWLIQLGISGYYDERRNEGEKPKAAAAADPIIPGDASASAPAVAAAGEVAATTDEGPDAPVVEAPATADVATGTEGEDELPPQATTPFPANPYQPDEDDD